MSQSKRKQKPWKASAQQDGCGWEVRDSEGALVCTVEYSPCDLNAQLIAAAPELLEALCVALPYVEDALKDKCFKSGTVKKAVNDIEKAIKKAIGKQGGAV